MFSFVVKEGEKTVATGTNDEDGIINFSPMRYGKEGTHTYTVTEVDSGMGGITYDGKVCDDDA
jgi:general stress protein 26